MDAEALRKILVELFNEDELRDLCDLTLKIGYANLRGEGNAAKARELVLLYERRLELDKLEAVLRDLRPRAFQPEARPTPLTAGPSEELRPSPAAPAAGRIERPAVGTPPAARPETAVQYTGPRRQQTRQPKAFPVQPAQIRPWVNWLLIYTELFERTEEVLRELQRFSRDVEEQSNASDEPAWDARYARAQIEGKLIYSLDGLSRQVTAYTRKLEVDMDKLLDEHHESVRDLARDLTTAQDEAGGIMKRLQEICSRIARPSGAQAQTDLLMQLGEEIKILNGAAHKMVNLMTSIRNEYSIRGIKRCVQKLAETIGTD
jgi:hypothetical protein